MDNCCVEETSSVAKRARITSQVEEESDRLSLLPECIIDQILSRVSIREAVRTSVLSSKWRYRWTTIPKLIFDYRCTPPGRPIFVPYEWHEMINHVLLFHTGTISKFVISHKEAPPVREADRWITYLSRFKVNELVLDFSVGMCKLPSSLFHFQDLTHLKLSRCAVKPPSRYGLFKNLKTLQLSYVDIAREVLAKMVLNCPLLEKMSFICVAGVSSSMLVGPKFHELEIERSFCVGAITNHMAVVALGFYKDMQYEEGQPNQRSNMIELSALMRHTRSLSVRKSMLMYWALKGSGYDKYTTRCSNLQSLHVEMNFGSLKEISVVLSFLRSFRNLKEVRFSARPWGAETLDTASNFWEGYHVPCSLSQLKFASFTGIRGTMLEMGFIRFLLSQSHMLERMEIGAAFCWGCRKLVMDLLAFKQAFPQVEFVYLGDCNPIYAS